MRSLEPCTACRAAGKPGGIYAFICEACGGFGLTWIERCYIGTIGDT
jgi:hypothetical protein